MLIDNPKPRRAVAVAFLICLLGQGPSSPGWPRAASAQTPAPNYKQAEFPSRAPAPASPTQPASPAQPASRTESDAEAPVQMLAKSLIVEWRPDSRERALSLLTPLLPDPGKPPIAVLTQREARLLTQLVCEDSFGRVFSRPQIMTTMGREARLEVGSVAPLYQRHNYNNGKLEKQTETLNAGLNLWITPQLRDNGGVNLHGRWDHSDLVHPKTPPVLPILRTRSIQFDETVPAGQTLLICQFHPAQDIGATLPGFLTLITPQVLDADAVLDELKSPRDVPQPSAAKAPQAPRPLQPAASPRTRAVPSPHDPYAKILRSFGIQPAPTRPSAPAATDAAPIAPARHATPLEGARDRLPATAPAASPRPQPLQPLNKFHPSPHPSSHPSPHPSSHSPAPAEATGRAATDSDVESLREEIRDLRKDVRRLITLLEKQEDAGLREGEAVEEKQRPKPLDASSAPRKRDDLAPTLTIRGPLTRGASAEIPPPSDDEVRAALIPHFSHNAKWRHVRLVKEKIADYVDEPRFIPLVGPAQLHHVHYKCTLLSDQDVSTDPLTPSSARDVIRGVVYIDHCHFHVIPSAERPSEP